MSVMTPPGLAIDSVKIALVFGRDGALERGDVVGVGPHHVPAEILERVIELVDRAAIELLRRDELVAGLQQAMKHQNLRGMAGRRRKSRGAAFERGDALFQHRSWSDCRCAYRCCRRSAGRTARRRDRRFRTRRTWSDRSASRARRWSDRVARRRERQAWRSPGCVRSSVVPSGRSRWRSACPGL